MQNQIYYDKSIKDEQSFMKTSRMGLLIVIFNLVCGYKVKWCEISHWNSRIMNLVIPFKGKEDVVRFSDFTRWCNSAVCLFCFSFLFL